MGFNFKKKRRPKAYVLSCSRQQADQERASNQNSNPELVYAIPAQQISRKTFRRSRTRIGMVGVCFVIVSTGLGVRLANVSFSGIPSFNTIAQKTSEGPRPEITDRNGVLLATNLPTIALEVAGKEVWDPKETAQALADIVENVDAITLEKKLARKQYVEVRSDLSPTEHADVFALGLPGVRFSRRDHRFYPQEGLAPHLIGHVEKGQVRLGDGGVMGLEKALDRQDVSQTLVASIDVRVQQVLEEVIAASVEEFSAEAGWGGVLDVNTGEMIAIASFPEFNLNDPTASSADARRNRMSYDRYDLGSAFKALTAASVIESNIADEQTPYDARGGLYVSGVTIKDYKGKNRILTLSEVVQHSSNIGTARMAAQLGPTMQQQYLKNLGLFEPLPLEIAENRAPDLPKKWGPVEAATVSYGHGIAVTPLHLLAAIAPVVNGGVFRVPTMIKVDGPRAGKPVFSEQTSAKMRRILRRTVVNGSAKRAEVAGYFPIGKTSTADKPGRGGYLKNARISSFVGAFPGYEPRYIVLVSLDNPQPTDYTHGYATAGWTAAPMFRKLVTRIGPILDVPMVSADVAMAAFFEGAWQNGDSGATDMVTLDAEATVRKRVARSAFSTVERH